MSTEPTTKPHPGDDRIFLDECVVCGRDAEFTGRFTEPDADGRRKGRFHRAGCHQTYPVWRHGLADRWHRQRPWILLAHDPRHPDAPVLARVDHVGEAPPRARRERARCA